MSNKQTFRQRAAEAARSAKFHAVTGGAALVPLSGMALAQDGFDAAEITAAITQYTGIAVGLVGAFILGVWSLRAMGLLKRG